MLNVKIMPITFLGVIIYLVGRAESVVQEFFFRRQDKVGWPGGDGEDRSTPPLIAGSLFKMTNLFLNRLSVRFCFCYG
jgi:hypothetical protein